MENLEFLIVILATNLSLFWLASVIYSVYFIISNWKTLKHFQMKIEWTMLVFTPLAIGWFIYLGVTYL